MWSLVWIVSHNIVFCILIQLIMGIKVNIVVLITGENVNNGYQTTGPMYEVAFQEMKETYPLLSKKVSFRIVYQANVTDCEGGGATMTCMAEQSLDWIRLKDSSNVVMTPGCRLELLSLADFARERDLLVIASNAGDVRLANPVRYPTFVTFAPVGRGGQAPAITAFLQKFSWTTVTLVCDNLTNYVNVAAFVGLMCRALRAQHPILRKADFRTYLEEFDSNRATMQQYQTILRRARLQCRIIIIVSREDIVRKFMITAHMLGMTEPDEYVYLYPESHGQPYLTNLLTPTDHPDDEVAVAAFPALIVINFERPNWDNLTDLLASVAHLAQQKYNYSYTHGENEQRNENSLSAYEAVATFMMVLNLSLELSGNKYSAREFRTLFLNRTFPLRTRDVRISGNGFPDRDITFRKFNQTSKRFQKTWWYSSNDSTLHEISPVLTGDWGGQSRPPPSIPRCGFIHHRCQLSAFTAARELHIAAPVVLLLLLGICTFSAIRLRTYYKKWREIERWWVLDPKEYAACCALHKRQKRTRSTFV